MFENEAKEYFRENAYNFDEVTACRECMEFGYNKANEWHYVKDGKYPKDNEGVLVLLKDKTTQVDYYFSKIGWNISVNADVIAWKEIVLPEL